MTNEDYDNAENYWIKKDASSKKVSDEETLKAYREYAASKNVCALATGSGDFVRATPIEYGFMDDTFYIFSEGGLKFKALRNNKNICLAIFDGYNGLNNIKGLQVTGKAELVEPFNDEYLMVVEKKNLPLKAFKKMEHPMNLLKIIPTHIDFLNTDFKALGGASRQSLDL